MYKRQGYNPVVAKWSPFHSAMYAVVESVAKIVAGGGRYDRVRLTFQEYFERDVYKRQHMNLLFIEQSLNYYRKAQYYKYC